jgi:hypothetical protein
MPNLTRVGAVLVKPELVSGTDSVPTAAANGIELEDKIWSTIETDYLELNARESVPGKMGYNKGAQPSGRLAKLTLMVPFKGAGAAYSSVMRPEKEAVIKASGMINTDFHGVPDAGVERIEYRPNVDGNTSTDSATCYVYAGGLLYKLTGVRGHLTEISLIPGRIVVGKYELIGLLPALPTEAVIPAISYPRFAVRPPPFAGATTTINGVGLSVASATLKLGTVVTPKARANATGGHAGYEITDVKPRLTVQIDRPSLAAFNPWVLRDSAAEMPVDLSWGVGGTGAYNRISITAPAAAIEKIPQQEKDGLAMLDLDMRLQNTATETGLVLTFR